MPPIRVIQARKTFCAALSGVLIAASAGAADRYRAPDTLEAPAGNSVERGRYIVKITGCNDCHTPGYAESAGNVPESQWLIGSTLGFRGPWGTTYPSNLRTYFQQLSENQWVEKAHTLETSPPMPWFSVRAISDADLRAMYRFMRHLGPAGEPAPQHVPPGQDVKPPYIQYPAPAK